MQSHIKEAVQMATLMEEIERYLRTVDAFRAEGCAPSWCDQPAGVASESWEED
jgi:hypothetical protein